ncbi:MAG: patatin, partial [Flavobacterium stagni]
VTTRAFDLLYAHTHMQKFGNCDLVIEPEALCNYSTFETNKSKMDEIFQIGYDEAKKRFTAQFG